MKPFYEHHGFDEWEAIDMEVEVGCRGDRPQPQCNRCGSYDVRWRQQGGKWVLFSLEPGKLHECDLADEFK